MPYIPRSLEGVVRTASKDFPTVVLTGPRQSGKTTVLRHLFARHDYVSLEPPDIRLSATRDPRGFLALHSPPVIFDEVQYAPDLLPYVKEAVDSRRDEKGLYLLTGSQNLLLTERVTETLAGRAAMLKLFPLSWREADGQPTRLLPWEVKTVRRKLMSGASVPDLWKHLIVGGYPELVANPGRDPSLWHASYVQTYLERDVRGLRQIGDLTLFQSFLRTLAARSGQLLNLTDVSRGLGIAVNTAKSWLAVLEATYQVIVIRPYFANVGKRLVKTPKVYFTDTGTLCYLTGLRDPEHAASGPMAGAIFETAVLSEIVRTTLGRGEEPHVFFWRTASGSEVDFIVEYENRLIPIEVKSTSTPRPEMAEAVAGFRRDFPHRAEPGYVVHAGDVVLPLVPGVTAIPFAAF